MRLSKLICTFFILHFLSDQAHSFPTIEGLLRNNSNLDHEIKIFSLSMIQQESDAINDEYLFVFSDQILDSPKIYITKTGSEKFVPLEISFKDDFSKNVQTGYSYLSKAYLALAHSLLFNREQVAIKMLRSFCGVVPPQSTLINESKKALLDELSSLVKRQKLKEEQIWRGLNQGQILQSQRIFNQPYYVADQGVSLHFEKKSFSYLVSLEHCRLNFNVGDLNLENISIMQPGFLGEIEFSESIAYNGVYSFPNRVVMKGNEVVVYKVNDIHPLNELPTWVKNAKKIDWQENKIFFK